MFARESYNQITQERYCILGVKMWDNVELLMSDDTGSGQLSISSRQECGSALYQMNTLVKITSSQKVAQP